MSKITYYTFSVLLVIITPFIMNISVLLYMGTPFSSNKQGIYVIYGIIVSLILIHFTDFLQRIYIFFHELSHMIGASLFSARVFEFKVKRDYGYIKSNKNNILIRLAPYLLPIFPYLLLLGHFLTIVYYRFHYGEVSHFLISILIISIFYTTTTYYNIKLIIKKTTDINKNELILSFLIIWNSYFFSSILLFYLLLNSNEIIEKVYFLKLK